MFLIPPYLLLGILFLLPFLVRVIDNSTMLKKIMELGSVQATATDKMSRQVSDFLQYAAT